MDMLWMCYGCAMDMVWIYVRDCSLNNGDYAGIIFHE